LTEIHQNKQIQRANNNLNHTTDIDGVTIIIESSK